MKAKILRIVAVLLLLSAIGAGAWWWLRVEDRPQSTSLVLHGNVDIRQVELAFNASGRIAQLLVHEGDRVKKGQLLAVLEVERLRNLVAQSQAQTATQRQILARMKAGSRPEEISKAAADAEAAHVEARNAARTLQRQEDLVSRHFIPQQQADDAKAAAEAAAARLRSVEEALRLTELGPRKEDIAAAQATLAANEAALAVAQRDLAEASLLAPADGIIQNRVLEVGDMASPQKTVLTLSLTEPLWVRAYLSEPDLGKVRIGSAAEVRTDSYPDKRYRAWVGFISPSAEFTPKSVQTQEVRTSLVYQVRVFVCAPREELRLGMPATVEIPLNQPATDDTHRGGNPCTSGS
jgi:HlyD family secretion protein